MRIDWAIPCRYCEVRDGELTMVGGGAGDFTVAGLPSEIGVWIALKIAAPEDMLGPENPHRFGSRVLGPDMQEAPGTQLDLEFEMAPAPTPGWEGEEIVSSYHVFRAEAEGIYTIDMSVDDRHSTVPLTVSVETDDATS
jgi:hypothetical protein